MKFKPSFWFGILWLQVLALSPGEAAAQLDVQKFTHYTVDDGLPSMDIYGLVQDSSGYIWLATNAGLCRFDGYHFHRYTTRDGLPSNDIIKIQYLNGRLWVSSIGPLSYYENGKFHIAVPSLPHSLENHLEFKITHTAKGHYWISHTSNLHHFDSNLRPLPTNPKIIGDFQRFWAFQRDANEAWVFRDSKLQQDFLVLRDTGIVRTIPLPYSCGDVRFFTPAFYGDYLYYPCDDGIAWVNTSDFSSGMAATGVGLANFMLARKDELWVAIPNQGITIFRIGAHGALEVKDHILVGQHPSEILFDREGNLWVSTLGRGLLFLPARAENVKVLAENDGLNESTLETAFVNQQGIWLGNRTGGLSLMQHGRFSRVYQLGPNAGPGITITNRIVALLEIAPQTLLIGADQGLYCLSGNTLTRISPLVIKGLSKGADGTIIVCTYKDSRTTAAAEILEAARLRRKDETATLEFLHPLFDGRCYSGLVDSKGRYWLGHAKEGLVSIYAGDTTYWAGRSAIFRSLVKDIKELPDGTICVATQGEGLLLIKDGLYYQLDESRRLANNFCNMLAVAEEGLWAGTNNGISLIQGLGLPYTNYRITNYRKSDGLLANDIKAIAQDEQNVYLATHRGLISLRKDELVQNETPPIVHITEVLVNEELQNIQGAYTLEPGQNNLTIRYVGLSYKSVGNIAYQYKLEGFDKDWIPSSFLETRYINLPPGHYKFKVKAISDHGMQSELSQPLDIVLKPHWTATLRFKLAVGLFALFVVSLTVYTIVARGQNRRLNRQVDTKTRQLNDKIKALAETNVKLTRSNQELEQFAHVASHDLKSPLRNIASFVQLLKRRALHKLSDEEVEYIDYAIRGAKYMEQLIDDLRSFSTIGQLNARKEYIEFGEAVREALYSMQNELLASKAEVLIATPMPILAFSRVNAVQLFRNLISNSIKFQNGEPPKILIGCEEQEQDWLFYVQDNGIGIDEAYQAKIFEIFQRLHTTEQYPGTGVGLAVCKKIIEENNGRIWFHSKEKAGATFFFTLSKTLEP
ncbi:MAG: hypothetical protein KDC66_11190 [Phaeodactylibacter sp.]|nr:hypothetical protein [Phaeodactylibacter sp.]